MNQQFPIGTATGHGLGCGPYSNKFGIGTGDSVYSNLLGNDGEGCGYSTLFDPNSYSIKEYTPPYCTSTISTNNSRKSY